MLVSSDKRIVGVVRRVTGSRFLVKHTSNTAQARRVIRQSALLDCAIVSCPLGRRDGFAAVVALREAQGGIPILVLGSCADAGLVNAAFGHQVGFVVPSKDLEAHLTAFLRRVASLLVYQEQTRNTVLEAFSHQVGLSIREAEVLAAVESGVPRGRIADTLGITENTVKTHVRAILRKANQFSLSEVVWAVRNADAAPAAAKGDGARRPARASRSARSDGHG